MRTPKDYKYLANLATTLIHRLGIPRAYGPLRESDVYADYGEQIKATISGWSPETLGRLTDFVPSRGLWETYHDGCLPRHGNGREFLIELACCAIVTEVYDLFKKSIQGQYARHAWETLGPDHPEARRLKQNATWKDLGPATLAFIGLDANGN